MYPCHTAFTRYPVFWCYIVQLFCQSIQLRSSHAKVFCKRGILRNFTKFFGKHLCQGLFFNKVAGPGTATLLKKRLWHRCFPVNFAKFLRIPFSKNTSRRLLISVVFHLIMIKTFQQLFSSDMFYKVYYHQHNQLSQCHSK